MRFKAESAKKHLSGTMQNDPEEIYSVSQLNNEVRRLLENHYPRVWVEGELSNLAVPRSGHWYLTLKDSGAQISGAMFKNRNRLVQFQPKDGDKIQVCGRLSLYQERGNYQLIIEHMRPAGTGQLQMQFEILKKQLQSEGLFNPEHKLPLPARPAHIAIITSPTGAAIRDMLHTFRRRFPAIEITLLPVAVQGNQAAGQIAAAINKANAISTTVETPFEAIIIGRGGGSLEDLWAFNEEVVARAIFASTLPVVSAVGHETDFSIADFVADVRAPTPTAAAEYLSPDKSRYLESLDNFEKRLAWVFRSLLKHQQHSLKLLQHRLVHPGQKIDQQKIQLDLLEQKLQRQWREYFREASYRLSTASRSLAANNPCYEISHTRQQLAELARRLLASQKQQSQARKLQLAHTGHMLNAVSPLATLARGFSITLDENGKALRDASTLKPGDLITSRLEKGQVQSQVLDSKKR